MSKVNRRKEIKEKGELQARFQLQMARNSSTVMSWLKPKDDISRDVATEKSFMDLPIVPQGAGLAALDTAATKVGDFIASGEARPPPTVHKDRIAQGSKPMMALLNRMRDSSRAGASSKGTASGPARGSAKGVAKGPARGPAGGPARGQAQRHEPGRGAHRDDSDDSDDDAMARSARAVKKSTQPFKGKGKGRPF